MNGAVVPTSLVLDRHAEVVGAAEAMNNIDRTVLRSQRRSDLMLAAEEFASAALQAENLQAAGHAPEQLQGALQRAQNAKATLHTAIGNLSQLARL